VAAAAVGSGVLSLASAIVSTRLFPAVRSNQDHLNLQRIHDSAAGYVVAGVLLVLGYALLSVVLWYLLKVTRYRQPALQSWLAPLIWLGPVLFAIALATGTADQLSAASDYVKGPLTEHHADVLTNGLSTVPRIIGQAGAFAIAVSLVMVSLNAMRVGLLTRFLGIIGMVIAALMVAPLLPGQVFQIFWLGAIAAIVVNRYPGGRGRSWETGEPDVWPSAAELRRAAAREGREETVKTGGITDPPLPEPPDSNGDGGGRSEHPSSKKRRKKRRR
jgi:hypothetical protein